MSKKQSELQEKIMVLVRADKNGFINAGKIYRALYDPPKLALENWFTRRRDVPITPSIRASVSRSLRRLSERGLLKRDEHERNTYYLPESAINDDRSKKLSALEKVIAGAHRRG
jgi:hypothetical protein